MPWASNRKLEVRMPTKPNSNIVPDYEEHPDLIALLARYAFLIEETVNFGSHVFTWIFETTNKGDHHIAAISFYRRSLELLDSIGTLIRTSCIAPSRVLLRSLFEALCSFEYMTKSELEKRGRAYILCLKHKEIDYVRKLKKDDSLHADYAAKLRRDSLLKSMSIPDIPNLSEAIAAKERLINSSFYESSEASYQAIRKSRKGKNPKWWFNLHDGPRDICDLAEKVGRPGQYEIMYRNWAGYAHGTGGMDEQVEIHAKDLVAIPQLRSPANAEFVTFMAISYGLIMIQTIVKTYAPDKMPIVAQWFKDEIQAGYMDLRKKPINVV